MSDEEVSPLVRVGPWVLGKVERAEEAAPPPDAAAIARTDVAFVIDATASMGPYIEEARRQAKAAADAVIAQGFVDARFFLAAYRDHPPQDRSWVTQSWACDDTNALQARLAELRAEGGGDAPEAVWDGVKAALDGFAWRPGSARLLYLIGDSPPHGHSRDHTVLHDGFPQGCPCGLTHAVLIEQLRRLNVTVHAVSIARNPDTARAFQLLSGATNGTCVEAQAPSQMTDHYKGVLGMASASNKLATDMSRHFGGMAADWGEKKMADYANAAGIPVANVRKVKAELCARGLLKAD